MCTHWLGLKYSGTNLLRIECIIWSSGMPIPITYSACKVERSISLATATSQAGFSSLIRETTFVFIKSKSGKSPVRQNRKLHSGRTLHFASFLSKFVEDSWVSSPVTRSLYTTGRNPHSTHPHRTSARTQNSWDSSIFLLPPPIFISWTSE